MPRGLTGPIQTRPWQFWIDRGGTFTDIVAQHPDGTLSMHKLLSENPERYGDAAIAGIREILQIGPQDPIPTGQIAAIKMGTTVATNALLERQGSRTLLLITEGFGDALRIGYQNRPRIFDRHIQLPDMLYERVLEVGERLSAQGEVLTPLRLDKTLRRSLQAAYDHGMEACAIVLLHGYRYPQHEQALAKLAQEIGFRQISCSHQVSPLVKLVSRGDTTVVDAYLSPILRRYVQQVAEALGPVDDLAGPVDDLAEQPSPPNPLMFMQSHGGLTEASAFQGKDSILSGPAGGIVGAVKTCAWVGADRIIGFDMGGTSTDVSHFNAALNGGQYERTLETEVAGVRLRVPMLAIHTVAAGGGSIVRFEGDRYRVGPASAGADPGPACYRKGGPLTVTDCNLLLGKLQPDFFPLVFGPGGNQPLDRAVVVEQFSQLSAQIAQATGQPTRPEQVAADFITLAVDKMANAIRKISLQRGYDVSDYTLCCFGGAGGQHACLLAQSLGMQQILIHPFAGVLSAYGMGLAEARTLKQQAIELPLAQSNLDAVRQALALLDQQCLGELGEAQLVHTLHLRYSETDTALSVTLDGALDLRDLAEQFHASHHQCYGFTMGDRPLMVESVTVEAIAAGPQILTPAQGGDRPPSPSRPSPPALTTVELYTHEVHHRAPVYARSELQPGNRIVGPALVIEATGTNVIEPQWICEVTPESYLKLLYQPQPLLTPSQTATAHPTPMLLEIFNNLFSAIAQEMGVTLQNTSHSVNIKERLDFSCAIFDAAGQLVANAPHIPVHLGSMSESVHSLIAAKGASLSPGDVYISNNPYNGGTHLPDITVITPVFPNKLGGEPGGEPGTVESTARPCFYVASRGHHADIGGITPGSMPPYSQSIEQEGILFDNFQLISRGQLLEADLLAALQSGPYPARNSSQNLADLRAQVAANRRGAQQLLAAAQQFGLPVVLSYMQYIQDNAEQAVRAAIAQLRSGHFTYSTDEGSQIQVAIEIDAPTGSATLDFTGTSGQQDSNFNAPLAVCKAAVLYVFRSLIQDEIPLNAGCLRPLDLIVPEGCMLNPRPPAAVVAGNVETSQAIVDALYGALGLLAASQGTMNNFTFGNERYQYYETICGGSGAGPGFAGTSGVQTHMTNSRLTDPEVLEWRFPVLVQEFRLRSGSGGAGQYPGGDGVVRRIEFREPMTAAILSSNRARAPFGLAGGQPGQVGRNQVRRADGRVEAIAHKAEVQMQAGDSFVIETPGGGGYGPREELG
jgi:5-oxoprolinase (ATP-hydrolysing)